VSGRDLERQRAELVAQRIESRDEKRRRHWQIWLLMARSQLNAAKQCTQRDQYARADSHRNQALQLLERIGLENLEVKLDD